MRRVEIDLAVYKAIEASRLSFEESENDILRRIVGIDPTPHSTRQPIQRTPRSSGAYSTIIEGRPVEGNSLKELLRRCILMTEKIQPGLIKTLAQQTTRRGRRIVARGPLALYPNAPQLGEFAERLNEEWWYDTNVGRRQVESYLKTLATLGHFRTIPKVAKRSQKSTVTLADLGL